MIKFLNNCVRLNKLASFSELKVLNQRRFISKTADMVAISKENQSAKYCFNLVRQYDYENYLCTLLMKDKCRQSAFGIRAFNVEISKIASVVSDDKIGTMRLKFWNDAIEKIFDTKQSTIPEHPVIKEIHLLAHQYFHFLPSVHHSNSQGIKSVSTSFVINIIPESFHDFDVIAGCVQGYIRLIKSRERPPNRGFGTVKELEQYAEDSVASIYYLLTKLLKCENMDVDHALSHLGKAHGIVNMLRAQCRLDRSKGVCIPQETMLKHGVSQERIMRNKNDDKGVQDCVFEIASVANSHLEKARNLSPKIPNDIKQLLLPAVGVGRYLERLRKCDFNLSHPQLAKRDSMLPLVFYWNFIRKQF